MAVIQILSPHVADLIAAGEVVERPASVVKELTENAFDAGAKKVTIELRGGGAPFIRVSDDGCGMAPEDAGVAFLRHATSKLRDENGLEAISTMGFRGEALAAISSVSHMELLTRRRGDADGTRVTLTAGEIQDMEAAGCPEGTVMTVRDLFYNTPARLKFMKSDRAEAAACVQTALRCALGRPDVSVRLIRDGKEEFFTPGDGRQDACVYALLGREFASGLLPCSSRDGGMRVTGFVSSPSAGRGNRSSQYFFCNGRPIRSQLLQAALEQAYRNSLLTGRYPACVLWLEMGYGSVDVNVHPAKTEVRFSFEKQVFDLVYGAAKLSLEAEDRSAGTEAPEPPRRPEAADGRAAVPALAPASPASGSFSGPREHPFPDAPFFAPEYQRTGILRSPSPDEQLSMDLSAPPSAPAEEPDPGKTSQNLTSFSAKTVEKPVRSVENAQVPPFRLIGEAMKTYLIVESGEDLILIDKHAAHERMNFDRLRAQPGDIASQTLLAPVPLRPGAEDAELLSRYGDLLSRLGFEIEPFGDRDHLIRAVPAGLDPAEALPAVEEILGTLRSGRTPDPQSRRDDILRTVACKAAVKAGWDTDPAEMRLLAGEVLSGRVRYCPHGRPVSAVLTRRELDRLFKRIV